MRCRLQAYETAVQTRHKSGLSAARTVNQRVAAAAMFTVANVRRGVRGGGTRMIPQPGEKNDVLVARWNR